MIFKLKEFLIEGTTHKMPIKTKYYGERTRSNRSLTKRLPVQEDIRFKKHKPIKNPWGESAPKNLNKIRAEAKHRELFCPDKKPSEPCVKN